MRLAIVVIIATSIFLIIGMSCTQEDSQQTPEMPKEIIGKDGAKMVLIPAGEFEIGTDPSEIQELVKLAKAQGISDAEVSWFESWFENETPRHTVYIDAFYMDAYEVTNAQYRKFVQETGYREPEGMKITLVSNNIIELTSGFKPWSDPDFNKDNQPVVCVTWEDAKAYAEWAGKRLPTEAEWEYAARGGLLRKRYFWGDDWLPPKDSGNFADETLKKAFSDWEIIIDGYDDGYVYTAPVGSYKPNGYGLYDIAGNVWEWCADWYDENYYSISPKLNPKGPDSGNYRVLRGGSCYLNSFFYPAHDLRVAFRFNDPINEYFNVGFRCVELSRLPSGFMSL